PAGAPLTRSAQPHCAQPDRNHVAIENRGRTIFGKQRDLPRSPRFVEDFDSPTPCRPLAVVDLSEIEHLSLNHATALDATVLDDRPGPMLLAVLAANLVAQKHAADSRRTPRRARDLVGTTAGSGPTDATTPMACRRQIRRKSQKSAPVGEVGLTAHHRIPRPRIK